MIRIRLKQRPIDLMLSTRVIFKSAIPGSHIRTTIRDMLTQQHRADISVSLERKLGETGTENLNTSLMCI
jgi:hypothetical protein